MLSARPEVLSLASPSSRQDGQIDKAGKIYDPMRSAARAPLNRLSIISRTGKDALANAFRQTVEELGKSLPLLEGERLLESVAALVRVLQ